MPSVQGPSQRTYLLSIDLYNIDAEYFCTLQCNQFDDIDFGELATLSATIASDIAIPILMESTVQLHAK